LISSIEETDRFGRHDELWYCILCKNYSSGDLGSHGWTACSNCGSTPEKAAEMKDANDLIESEEAELSQLTEFINNSPQHFRQKVHAASMYN
jgi:hypothetical protein